MAHEDISSRTMKSPKTILFICLGNACRSIMAEAIVNTTPSQWKAISAGVHAIYYIPPNTFHALEEINVLTKDLHSKQLTPKLIHETDYIIILDKTIRLATNKPTLHWDVQDPYRESLELFREVRDELRRRIHQFLLKNE